MSDLEQQYVQEVFDINWIASLGPYVDAFERESLPSWSGQSTLLPSARGRRPSILP